MKTKAQELGITTFPYREFDDNGNESYTEYSDGTWFKTEYDKNGHESYIECDNGDWGKWKCDDRGNRTYFENVDGLKEYYIT